MSHPTPLPQPETILLQRSRRGMEHLAALLPPDFCRRAARALLDCPRGEVWLATGFYVGGSGETDGPPGVLALYRALEGLGFAPKIFTDRYCSGYFPGMDVEQVPLCHPLPEEYIRRMLSRAPVAAIAVERCGRTREGDYQNMQGVSIRERTAPIDELFLRLPENTLTIGVGDGGNEVGMGRVAQTVEDKLALQPCVVPCDHLVVATVSNWGAYGLCAVLSRLTGRDLLPTGEQVDTWLRHLNARGSRDGVLSTLTPTVDGFPEGTEADVAGQLRRWALQA